jgi:hypothetical protein
VIADLVKSKGELFIFDYATQAEYTSTNVFSLDKNGFTPLRLDNIAQLLGNAGWHLEKMINMSSDYIRWYEKLLINLANKKYTLINEIGQDTFAVIYNNFNNLLTYLYSGEIMGYTVYAKKIT